MDLWVYSAHLYNSAKSLSVIFSVTSGIESVYNFLSTRGVRIKTIKLDIHYSYLTVKQKSYIGILSIIKAHGAVKVTCYSNFRSNHVYVYFSHSITTHWTIILFYTVLYVFRRGLHCKICVEILSVFRKTVNAKTHGFCLLILFFKSI